MITHNYTIITHYYNFIITSLLRHYYVIITSLLQKAKLCNNDSIITYYYIGYFHYNAIITYCYHYYLLLRVWDRALCRWNWILRWAGRTSSFENTVHRHNCCIFTIISTAERYTIRGQCRFDKCQDRGNCTKLSQKFSPIFKQSNGFLFFEGWYNIGRICKKFYKGNQLFQVIV